MKEKMQSYVNVVKNLQRYITHLETSIMVESDRREELKEAKIVLSLTFVKIA